MSNDPNSIKEPTIDIGLIVEGILKKELEKFLNNPKIQELLKGLKIIKEDAQDFNLIGLYQNIIDVFKNILLSLKDFSFGIVKTTIETKITENQVKISEQLRFQGKTEEQIQIILKKLSDLTDLSDIDFGSLKDFSQLKEILEDFILKKLKIINVTSEKQITEVLEKFINSFIKSSVDDAAASLPHKIMQALASMFPVGTEPLVAVNILNDMIAQFIQIVIDTLMEGAVSAIELNPVPTNGGRRKKKRKSKSKHFYLNRIKQTLKQFYNY